MRRPVLLGTPILIHKGLCSSFRVLCPHCSPGNPPVDSSSSALASLKPSYSAVWASNGGGGGTIAAFCPGLGVWSGGFSPPTMCRVVTERLASLFKLWGLWVVSVLGLDCPIAAVLNDCSYFGPLGTCCCGDCFHSNVCCPSGQLMKWLLKLWGPC